MYLIEICFRGVFPSFRDWIIERLGETDLRPLPELARMLEAFHQSGKNMVLQDDET